MVLARVGELEQVLGLAQGPGVMLVWSISDCYHKDFMDENSSANTFIVLVSTVNAIRSHFGHHGVLSSSLLEYSGILEIDWLQERHVEKYSTIGSTVDLTMGWSV